MSQPRESGEAREEVTRCICGHNDDQDGFMILCDKCFVWQHGECVGIPSADDAPNTYKCEECDPNHSYHTTGLISRKRKGSRKEAAPPAAKRAKTSDSMDIDSEEENEDDAAQRETLSREDRKIKLALRAFERMEAAEKRKRSKKGGNSPHPDSADEDIPSLPPPSRVDIRRLHMPRLSPMYLGKKAWLLSHIEPAEDAPNMRASDMPISKRLLPPRMRVIKEEANGVDHSELKESTVKAEPATDVKSMDIDEPSPNHTSLPTPALSPGPHGLSRSRSPPKRGPPHIRQNGSGSPHTSRFTPVRPPPIVPRPNGAVVHAERQHLVQGANANRGFGNKFHKGNWRPNGYQPGSPNHPVPAVYSPKSTPADYHYRRYGKEPPRSVNMYRK